MFKVADFDPGRCADLEGKIVGRQIDAVLVDLGASERLTFRCCARRVAPRWHVQQIIRSTVAGNDLAHLIVRNPNGRRHGVHDGLQLGHPLPLASRAFTDRLFCLLTRGDVAEGPDPAVQLRPLPQRMGYALKYPAIFEIQNIETVFARRVKCLNLFEESWRLDQLIKDILKQDGVVLGSHDFRWDPPQFAKTFIGKQQPVFSVDGQNAIRSRL